MKEAEVIEAPLEKIDSVARKIAKRLPEHAIVFLRGDLAAGKTTLVRALAKIRGYGEAVTSPTFSIQQIYGKDLFHYDLYQCPNEKFLAMGLLESLEEPGWHLIEWGDENLENYLKAHGFSTVVIEIEPTESGRRYRISADA
ncbi:tRNA (adenosine(37)-N6)-threonylcarbamoyltransferase complex ATPase subunit type 1 TsaE [Hydrogenimonas urashimensis]|uniref:tRNA (adenosine(37)-N6)-threonylcarbamoyltransferase complex ATPase subunit type 1 TsaE n=1 Tax=Hydrogenimonas urashimensis TaxID=2740515 RepID=UPI001916A13F|nr:tRNA (adenosine(37)-N6)-threonylcarbamoyltransferase complex ATPase subunit type 1 TsaE [Hydrogenimonas urashimensis]